MELKEIDGLPDYSEILPLLKAEWSEWPAGSGHENDSDEDIIRQMKESHLVEADIVKYLFDESRIIGFYRYTRIPRDKPDTKTAHTLDISILPGYQKRGLGCLLMRDMIHDCRSRGFHTLQSRTAVSNQASNALHRKFGFRKLFEKEGSLVWELAL